MEIAELYNKYLKNPNIVIDSRQARPGSIFFGLRGEHDNGGKFARQAIDAGCAAAIVDDRSLIVSHFCILVEDTLKTLTELAAFHRSQLSIPVIALTGSNGKTTTKELIAAVLGTRKKVLATSGNLNNHIGVPLTLLSIREEHEIAVIELGANHPGEIAALSALSRPTHGLITMIGRAHLEGFGSPEGVIAAKSELYHYLKEHGGTIFVNTDDPLLLKQLSDFRGELFSYGTTEGEFCHGSLVDDEPYLALNISGSSCSLSNSTGKIARTRLIGSYNLPNALAAACVGMYFGIELSDIVQGLSDYEPKNTRSQFLRTNRNELILDYYNANPSSMELAIQNFGRLKAGKKMLILGDMLELGDYSQEEHENISKLASQSGAELIFLVGSQFANGKIASGQMSFSSSSELAEYLASRDFQGYQVLIKGSRGIKLEQVVPYL
jgi:UDP-N-acetylmuramoyl-tripeptide--D-alanyl-D-alanine ligase